MKTVLFSLCISSIALSALAHSEITTQGDQTCITSDATPNHEIGSFPNSGNPHSFRAQNIRYCFDANPERTGSKTDQVRVSGISLTGIPFRPGTADYYDPSSPRGHSRNRASGWNLEGMGAAETLGMDAQNAHVDHRGLYHYHGVSSALISSTPTSLIGYAADGFEIHYVGEAAKSSWQLKSGERPTAPYGTYDGTYEQDWVYVQGSGNLDECNGGKLNGKYVYFNTDRYPFYPRCFWGNVSRDFMR